MKTEPKDTALLFAAGVVFLAGCLAWAFPRAATATVGEWFLPALSVIGLVLAVAMASPWRLLRGLLFVLAIVLVVAWNRASVTSTSHFAGAALGCLVMVGIGRWAKTPWRLRFSVFMFLCAGLVMLIAGLAGASKKFEPAAVPEPVLPTNRPPIQLGLSGLGAMGVVNPNALASAVLLVLPVGIAVMVFGTRQKVHSWTLLSAAFVVVSVGTTTLALTGSRTALLAVWLMALGLLVRGMRSRLLRAIAGTVVLAPLIALTGRLIVVTQNEASIDAQSAWVSAHFRGQILSQAVDRWKQSPWVGIGLNEFRTVYATRPGDLPLAKDDVVHAHNIFVQTALDIGVVGSVAYWSVLAFLWVRASQAASGSSRTARAAAVGAAFTLIAATLFGLTDAVALGAKVGTLQWIAGGLILAAWQIRFDRSDAGDDFDANASKHATSAAAA